jgi:hypothetical protein
MMHGPLDVKLYFCMIQATTKDFFFLNLILWICIYIFPVKGIFSGLPNLAYT